MVYMHTYAHTHIYTHKYLNNRVVIFLTYSPLEQLSFSFTFSKLKEVYSSGKKKNQHFCITASIQEVEKASNLNKMNMLQ